MTATPSAPDPGKKAADAAAHAPIEGGAKRNFLLTTVPEAIGKGIWGIVKGTWNRVFGVLGQALDVTVGQVIHEGAEIGKRLGFPEVKEQGLFRQTAGIIENVNTRAMKVMRWPIDFAVNTFEYAGTLPGRVAGRTLRAVQNTWEILWHGKHSGADSSVSHSEAAGHASNHGGASAHA